VSQSEKEKERKKNEIKIKSKQADRQSDPTSARHSWFSRDCQMCYNFDQNFTKTLGQSVTETCDSIYLGTLDIVTINCINPACCRAD